MGCSTFYFTLVAQRTQNKRAMERSCVPVYQHTYRIFMKSALGFFTISYLPNLCIVFIDQT